MEKKIKDEFERKLQNKKEKEREEKEKAERRKDGGERKSEKKKFKARFSPSFHYFTISRVGVILEKKGV